MCFLFKKNINFLILLQCFLAFAVFIASVYAETPIEDIEAHVEENDFKANDDAGYKYNYRTSNKIQATEEGDGTNIVEGSYSYVDPEGKTHTVTYIAGAGIGFKPLGDDIHPDVSAAIDLNLKNPPQEEKKE